MALVLLGLAVADPVQSFDYFVHVHGDLHQLQVFLESFSGNLIFYFRLHDMVNRKAQRNASQRACPARIAVYQGFRIEFRAIGIWSTENSDEIVVAVFIG